MIFTTLLILFLSIASCNNDKADTIEERINNSLIETKTDSIFTLTENQKKILEGARETLENGADAYMTKSLSSRELVARVRALLRRKLSHDPTVVKYIWKA